MPWSELGHAKPSRQALLLVALADRGDKTVLPVVLDAAKRGPVEVRSVALGLLKQLGNVSCVAPILEESLSSDADLAQTAIGVLAEMPGQDVDADLAARLLKAEGKTRQVLIELAGRRRIAAATAALLKAADDPDPRSAPRAHGPGVDGRTGRSAGVDCPGRQAGEIRGCRCGGEGAQRRLPADGRPRGDGREVGCGHATGAGGGPMPHPGSARRDGWTDGAAGRRRRGERFHSGSPRGRQPALGRMDGRRCRAGAA